MIISALGHRYYKLPGHPPQRFKENHPHTKAAFDLIYREFDRLKPDGLICGASLGFDLLVGLAAARSGVPYLVALRDRDWSKQFRSSERGLYFNKRRLFEELTGKAKRVHVVSGKYAGRRDERHLRWRIEHADSVLALWDGSRGDVHDHIMHAWSRRKNVDNLWSNFLKLTVETTI